MTYRNVVSAVVRAQRNMKCIVMHSEFGEVARHTVSPDMLKEVAA